VHSFYSIGRQINWFDILVSIGERGLHVTEYLWVTYDLLMYKAIYMTDEITLAKKLDIIG
jgi:hypothetical protein